MLEAGVLVPKNSLYNSSVWLMEKADGSWRLIVDCQGFNKIVPPIASADSEIVWSVGKKNTKGDSIVGLASAFSHYRSQFLHVGRILSYIYCITTGLFTFTCLLSVTGWKKFDLDAGPNCNNTLHWRYDNIETEAWDRTDLSTVMTHMTHGGWLINPAKTQGSTQTVNVFRINWAGATCDIL